MKCGRDGRQYALSIAAKFVHVDAFRIPSRISPRITLYRYSVAVDVKSVKSFGMAPVESHNLPSSFKTLTLRGVVEMRGKIIVHYAKADRLEPVAYNPAPFGYS